MTRTTHPDASTAAAAVTETTRLVEHCMAAAASEARTGGALLAAEARLAGLSLFALMFLGILAALLAFGAWGLLVAAVIVTAINAGHDPAAVLVLACTAHGLVALTLWRYGARLAEHLTFPETRRLLGLKREPA